MFRNDLMQRAISCASSNKEEVPVGAIIVDESGDVLSESSNQTKVSNDPTLHAEIIAIREACSKVGADRLQGCSLFVTLEPCAMCAAAISYAKIKHLFYGAADKKFGAIESNMQIFQSSLAIYKPNIYSGIMERECREIIQKFFQGRR